MWDGVSAKWVNNGKLQGAKGDNGEQGVTFTPRVESNGNLSWTNDGGLENPATVNIMGAKGDKGDKGDDGKSPYQAACEAGYTGTEQTFNATLTSFPYHNVRHLPDGADPITVKTGNIEDNAVTAAKLKDGAVSRSKLARDALYSPILAVEADTLIGAEHCGVTLLAGAAAALSLAYDETIPVGTEFAVLNAGEAAVTISAGVNTAFLLCDGSTPGNVTVTPFGMAAAKLISRDTVERLDRWYVTGNVEVVE